MKIISESFTEFDCIYQAYSTEQAKRIIYLMYFIRNLTRLLVLTLHPCALIRQRSFLKEPTGEWILLQKKLDFPDEFVPTNKFKLEHSISILLIDFKASTRIFLIIYTISLLHCFIILKRNATFVTPSLPSSMLHKNFSLVISFST